MITVKPNRILLPLVAAFVSASCADTPSTAPAARTLAAGAEVQQDRASGRCRNVEGTIVEAITGANTAAGTITGDFAGDVSIVITSLTPSGGGAMHFEGICTIVTPEGTITTNDAAVLSPIDAPLFRVNNRLTVVGGTGAYAGATGELHTHGTANFVPGGVVDLRYEGRVCNGS